MRAREFIRERSGNKLIPIDGASVVNYHGRMMVLTNIGGTRVPFYLSSGQAGKDRVPAGRWYPFFGIGADGWINKGSQLDMANYYYSPTLKATAHKLDAQIGDIRNDDRPKPITKSGMDLINTGLDPVSHGDADAVKRMMPKIKKLIAKIGGGIDTIPSMAAINPSIAAYKAGRMNWEEFSGKVRALQPKLGNEIVDYVMFQIAPGA